MVTVRTWALFMIAVGSATCSSTPPLPTKEQPIPACYVSCPDGYSFKRQLICRGGHRYFTDVLIVGEYQTRGADGELLTNAWIGKDGQLYDKDTIRLGSCSGVVRGIIQAREPSERGQHPGETPDGWPAPPRS